MMEVSKGIVLLGDRCTGKSTLVKLLSKFLEISKKISLRVSYLNPGVYTNTEMYGAQDTDENARNGLMMDPVLMIIIKEMERKIEQDEEESEVRLES